MLKHCLNKSAQLSEDDPFEGESRVRSGRQTHERFGVAVAKVSLLLLCTPQPSAQLPCRQGPYVSYQWSHHIKPVQRDECEAMDLPR